MKCKKSFFIKRHLKCTESIRETKSILRVGVTLKGFTAMKWNNLYPTTKVPINSWRKYGLQALGTQMQKSRVGPKWKSWNIKLGMAKFTCVLLKGQIYHINLILLLVQQYRSSLKCEIGSPMSHITCNWHVGFVRRSKMTVL